MASLACGADRDALSDHCPKDKLDGFMRPLVKISQERVARGEEPLFNSHMWDGSAVPLDGAVDASRGGRRGRTGP